MEKLTELYCQPVPEGTAAMPQQEAADKLVQIPGWEVSPQNDRLTADFHFKNYYETIAFVNAVAWIAHTEDHHPHLLVGYNKCTIVYNTHTVKGLSLNDFICAAKVNQLRSHL
ncbi:MAG: 4a-hydroxytetrahydrobiopterin dehydratase [Legionellales bacterium]|nr:4a-hydroxytetrahydrobiopterin dehydratase [Legionellales bacterium]